MVMEIVHEDLGEGNMGCVNHQYKNSSPGGICAFCLQEKLGKLVSSSFPVAVFPSSSSSTPSFRSDFGGGSAASTGGRVATLEARRLAWNSSTHSQFPNHIDTPRGKGSSYLGYDTTRRSRLPFILTRGRQKQKDETMASSDSNSIIFRRSMSTTPPRRGVHFLAENHPEDHSHRTKFWSFLYMPKLSTNKTTIHSKPLNSSATPRTMCGSSSRDKKKEDFVDVDETEDGSADEAAFDRKVSRSRSVGCGSRSFSGDFFEKISTGFGDCTLRRVESQREAKPKTPSVHKIGVTERVKCGGIFSGFMTASSSSSSSTEDKSISATHSSMVNFSLGRIRWRWALVSPMRAFGKQPSTGKSVTGSIKNATSNLAAIPSLLAA